MSLCLSGKCFDIKLMKQLYVLHASLLQGKIIGLRAEIAAPLGYA